MKKTAVILMAIILGISCATQDANPNNYQKVGTKVFLKGIVSSSDNIIIVDVRTPNEYSKGNIKNSININYYDSNFQEQISKLDTLKTAYIYCKSGGRSSNAVKTFTLVGFKKVVELKGGFNAYLKQ